MTKEESKLVVCPKDEQFDYASPRMRSLQEKSPNGMACQSDQDR